jgi:hypothetical protein
MKPHVLGPAKSCQFRQWINRARSGCPGGPDHHQRLQPLAAILGYTSGEIVYVHLKVLIGRYTSDRISAKSCDVRNLVE